MTQETVQPNSIDSKEDSENRRKEQVLRRRLRQMSWLFKVLNGEDFDPDSRIEYLTDIEQLSERTRLPTYSHVGRQVFLRQIAAVHPECVGFQEVADFEAHHMISFKGLSREEFVNMKRASQQPGQLFQIGGQPKPEQKEETKSHFWNRGKKEETE